MIRSMTGFGSDKAKSKYGVVTAEIKTVNHKFLEISCKLPNSLVIFEERIKSLLQRGVKRGKVYFNLIYEGTSPHVDSLYVDKKLAENYYNKLNSIKKTFKLEGGINLSDIISFPGVLNYRSAEKDISKLWPSVHTAADSALAKLINEREKEGRYLYKDFKKRIKKIKRYVVKIEDRAYINVKNYKRKLEQRIKEISRNYPVNNERLEMEVVLYAKNSDISEEITRLKNHIFNFDKTIGKRGEAGKKLDFIAQELHREINTVGSKSSDYTISKSVIEIKSEIEKIREQLKNIE
ncbi:MAG: YicC family protein [Candidatus Omnitrophica bacterium]|nr:YicC family protein [Candidatus Omnitrophota bacterium]